MRVLDDLMWSDRVYRCGEKLNVIRRRLTFPELGEFASSLRNFKQHLGIVSEEEYWASFFRPLRRYAFFLSSTPLPTNDPAIYDSNLRQRLESHLHRVNLLYPDSSKRAHAILDNLSSVERSNCSLAGEVNGISSLRPEHETTALLLIKSALRSAIEVALAQEQTPKIHFVGPSELRRELCYDNLIIIGSPTWYPEYIFTAPRVRQIYLIAYNWLRSKWEPEATFVETQHVRATSQESPVAQQRVSSIEDISTNNSIEADDLIPVIDLDALSGKLSQSYSTGVDYDLVDAKLLTLEGGAFVFIDASDGAKQLIIDPEGSTGARTGRDSPRLRRIPTSYLEPGDYVVLRTSGGGDLIKPIANAILGNNASYIRVCQEHWKGLLRSEVRRRGLFDVSVALLDLGSIRAEESNLRNWISPRSIRPDDKRDFAAIMRAIGLGDKIDEYWLNATALTNAHLRAGAIIRRKLLKEVATADLDELEKNGRMVFVLPGGNASSMTAFRVLSISQKTFRIPASQIDQPLDNHDELWAE